MYTKYKCTIQGLQETDTVLVPMHIKKVSIASLLCLIQAFPNYCPNPTPKVTSTLTLNTVVQFFLLWKFI